MKMAANINLYVLHLATVILISDTIKCEYSSFQCLELALLAQVNFI